MVFHNFFTNGKSYARSFILTSSVKPLKNGKDLSCIFIFKANAIICKLDPVVLGCLAKLVMWQVLRRNKVVTDLNNRLYIGFDEFQRIAQQVLEKLAELGRNDVRYR